MEGFLRDFWIRRATLGEKTSLYNLGSNFLVGSFSNRHNLTVKSNLDEKDNASILKMIFPPEQTRPFSHQ